MKHIIYFLLVVILLIVFCSSVFTGCSGQSYNSARVDNGGAYLLRVNWPGGETGRAGARLIPDTSSSIFVSITGVGLSLPLTTLVARSQSQSSAEIVFENIPAGNKVATIKTLDASSKVTAQRKESFVIYNNQTETSTDVPLGIAITGTATSPTFEPSSINTVYGRRLYFQNWTGANLTCKVLIDGQNQDVYLPGASQDPAGKWVFQDGNVTPLETTSFELQEYPSVKGSAYAPILKYRFVRHYGIGDGTAGSGNNQLNNPSGIALDSGGKLYTCDRNNYRVIVYNSAGNFYAKFGTSGTGNGQFSNGTVDIKVSPAGYIYVSDNINAQMQRFNSAFQFNRRWGSFGTANNQYSSVTGLALDSQENLFVGEFTGNTVKKTNYAGTYITRWGSTPFVSGASGNGQFDTAFGLATNSNDQIFVADFNNHRIQKFTSIGVFLTKFGSAGTGNGQFSDYPKMVAVDKFNNIYVGEQDYYILKFDSSFRFLTKFGGSGTSNSSFNRINGIVVDENGRIYVCESFNHRLKLMEPDPVQ